ncbi:RNA-directed DNA polymerase, eukaryota [Tanacetum coccineum]
MGVVKSLQDLEKLQSLEAAQKAKIKWAIEGDENSKYYHGILNRKRNQLTIRGVLEEGTWIDNPLLVKREFLDHFKTRFDKPDESRIHLNMHFLNTLSSDQQVELEIVKRGDKKGGSNSSFIALILKIPDANMVKDFRPISLIGSLYKIIANILANRLLTVLGDIVNEVQSAFVVDRQILDGPFISNELFQWYDILKKFGFGERWCGWIQIFLKSSRGSIIVNGSPTEEFQFYKGLKKGDPLSLFLFILVMESLHISFQRVVDACMFKGIALGPSLHLSYMFYADDAVFVGQWSDANIDTIVHVLECFYRASGMRINMNKIKLTRISVEEDKVQFRRTSLTGFPAQSIRSSNVIPLDSPYLLVLITGTSQSRQHGKSESDSYYLTKSESDCGILMLLIEFANHTGSTIDRHPLF